MGGRFVSTSTYITKLLKIFDIQALETNYFFKLNRSIINESETQSDTLIILNRFDEWLVILFKAAKEEFRNSETIIHTILKTGTKGQYLNHS